MRIGRYFLLGLAIAFCVVFAQRGAWAQSPRNFYKDRTITFYLATPPGGSWDVYSRILISHFSDHIPGHPKIILQYMPGAGGVRLLNFMAQSAPKDGSAIATPLPTSLLSAAFAPKQSHFSPPAFQWLGSMARIQDVISVGSSSPVQSISAAKRRPATMGATGTGSNTYFDVVLANALLHTKFKLVMGYEGSSDLDLAIERGEIDGRADTWDDWTTDHSEWVKDGKIKQLVQIGLTKLPEIGDVPLFSDLVANKQDKKLLDFLSPGAAIGRALFAPPGTPPDRVAVLRDAFAQTMNDPGYLADARSHKLSAGDWKSGVEVQKTVEDDFNAPPQLVGRAKSVMALH